MGANYAEIQELLQQRADMKANIYDQAVLEGVATSLPQTEDIIENGHVNGVSASDVQKILNLKHATGKLLEKFLRQNDNFFLKKWYSYE